MCKQRVNNSRCLPFVCSLPPRGIRFKFNLNILIHSFPRRRHRPLLSSLSATRPAPATCGALLIQDSQWRATRTYVSFRYLSSHQRPMRQAHTSTLCFQEGEQVKRQQLVRIPKRMSIFRTLRGLSRRVLLRDSWLFNIYSIFTFDFNIHDLTRDDRLFYYQQTFDF